MEELGEEPALPRVGALDSSDVGGTFASALVLIPEVDC